MRILALETTDKAGGVAALDGHNLLACIDLSPQERSAQALAPAIHALWRDVGWQPGDMQLIAVAVGPGSFTGLRVGITMAKTLAYALGCEVSGVHTLEVIASQTPAVAERLHVWLDAQREQVFAATFACRPGERPTCLAPARILDNAAAVASLSPGDFVSGPALRKLAPQVPSGVHVVAEEFWRPTATAIGLLALRRYEAGERDDLWKLAPLYLRQSAAEEKWARQQKDQKSLSP